MSAKFSSSMHLNSNSTHRYFQLDVLRRRLFGDEILQYCNCRDVVALEFRLTSENCIGSFEFLLYSVNFQNLINLLIVQTRELPTRTFSNIMTLLADDEDNDELSPELSSMLSFRRKSGTSFPIIFCSQLYISPMLKFPFSVIVFIGLERLSLVHSAKLSEN